MKTKFDLLRLLLLLVFFSVAVVKGHTGSTSLLKTSNKTDFLKVFEGRISKSIEGRVVDEDGEPLIGVNVLLKGTDKGTATDFDGYFTLDDVNTDDILIVSYVGYQTQEVIIGEAVEIEVVLISDSQLLDEVIVVGYGTQKKANLTGSVAVIDSRDLESRPVVNVSQALQGLAPGLNISQSGSLGGSLENRPSINIRGIGTIGEGSTASPLILIDGVEGDINALNPQDIESISVLKDAASSSIYGSRAPFGVILITTRGGKAGKASINLSSNFRFDQPVLIPEMMDSYSFAMYFNDAGINAGQSPFFTNERLDRIQEYQNGTLKTTLIPRQSDPSIWADGYLEGNDNVDWYKALFKDRSFSQNYSLDASGGNENIQYFISGNLLNQPGLMVFGKDQFDRYNTTARVDGRLTNWLSVQYRSRFSREEFQRPSYMNGTFYNDIARQGWPVLPLYDNNGQLYDSPSPALGLRDGGKAKMQNDNFLQQLNVIVEPLPDLKIFGSFAYTKSDDFYHWDLQQTFNYNIANEPYPAKTTSKAHEEALRSNYLSSNIYGEYMKTFLLNTFKIMAGIQYEQFENRFIMAEREGIIVPEISLLDGTSGTDYNGKTVPPLVSGKNNDWATEGYFGRLNYDFDDKYLLELNIRYDGSSRFRKESRWILSPSISAGWNISQENFFDSIRDRIDMLKLRGSYGILGNPNTDNWYPTYLTMPIGISNGNWLVNNARPNTASAPGLISSTLTWEKIKSWNIGVDIGAMDGKLSLNFDYFNRLTEDMIGPAPELPSILGTSVPRLNNTDLKTSGFELNMQWQDFLSQDFHYSVGLLLSDSKTRITRYPNPTNSIDRYIEGQLMGEIWGYSTIGIAKTDDEMRSYLESLGNGGQNALGSKWGAGDIMYKDVNGDGAVDEGARTLADHGDLKVIGNSTPRYSMGINLAMTWKRLDFRTFFQGVLKRDYFHTSPAFWGIIESGIWQSAGLVPHLDYFRGDEDHPLGLNLNSYYPRPLFDSGRNQWPQTRYLQDASYVRLKSLQIGYSISPKIGMNRVRIYLSGENVLTFSRTKNMFDPETIDGGENGNVYPLFKSYSIGFNINL